MGAESLTHWIIIGIVLLIFFGPGRLPALGQSLGKAIRGFKQGLNEIDTEAKDVTNHQQLNQNQQGMNQNTQTQNTQQNDTQNTNNKNS